MARVKIAIQQAKPEECAPGGFIHDLHCLTFGETAPVPDFRTGFWWLAYHGKHERPTYVAFAGLRMASHHKNWGYLCRCGVLPNWRGEGLQRRLIFAREKFARRLRLAGLVTDTYHNPRSADNLMQLGYQEFRPKTPWSFAGAQYWRKEL